MKELEHRSVNVAPVSQDVVLRQAHAAIGWRGISAAAGDWRRRVPLALRLLFPSAAYMRRTRNVPHAALLPWYYAARIWNYLAGSVRSTA